MMKLLVFFYSSYSLIDYLTVFQPTMENPLNPTTLKIYVVVFTHMLCLSRTKLWSYYGTYRFAYNGGATEF